MLINLDWEGKEKSGADGLLNSPSFRLGLVQYLFISFSYVAMSTTSSLQKGVFLITLSDHDIPVLERWGVLSTFSLPILQGPF